MWEKWKSRIVFIATVTCAIFAVWAVPAAYDIYNKSIPRKQLDILIDTIIPLVNIDSKAGSDISILYKGQSVKNVVLVQMTINNTGNQPILRADYDKPISFLFTYPIEIADVSVIDANPPNISLVINKISQYRADVDPLLLNPGDIINIRFTIIADSSDSVTKNLHLDGRIVGIKTLELKVLKNLQEQGTDFALAIASPTTLIILFGILIVIVIVERRLVKI